MTLKRAVECVIGRIGTATALIMWIALGTASVSAEDTRLPQREGPPVQTTPDIPHVQLGVQPVPEVRTELLRRVRSLPGLEIRPTIIGMWGTDGFWLRDDKLEHANEIFRGREFAHLHPDGSLHASLPPGRALEAIDAGWATAHPSAQFHARLAGFVMLFSPRNEDEAEVTFGLIVDAYNHFTGKNLIAADFP